MWSLSAPCAQLDNDTHYTLNSIYPTHKIPLPFPIQGQQTQQLINKTKRAYKEITVFTLNKAKPILNVEYLNTSTVINCEVKGLENNIININKAFNQMFASRPHG